MPKYYIRARSLTGLREIAQQVEGDVRAALDHVGLDPALLRRPDDQMDFLRYCELLEHCARIWNMPDLGFRMAPYQHLEVLGPVALVTRMELNLRDALKAIMHNLVVYTNVLRAALEERGDVAAVVLAPVNSSFPMRQYLFLALGVTKNVVEQSAGRPISFVEATFRDPADRPLRAAEGWFGCPVRFGMHRDALYFERAQLDTALERSDVGYHSIIRHYLASERETATGGIVDAARGEIARQMELGNCSLDSVAHALRLEPRSLQRRMKAQGGSFRGLVDDWRRERAMQLVTMTRKPLSDIADVLGYAHQAVFTRAFMRWYNSAPLAYRQQAANAVQSG